jgi:hypothetical protein
MYELIPLYIPQQYLALKVMRELVCVVEEKEEEELIVAYFNAIVQHYTVKIEFRLCP